MAITINVNLDEILAALKNDLDFTGNADKYIKVNATADGFEFADIDLSAYAPLDDPTFTTKITTPIVRASDSGGLIFQSSNGTQVADFGAGGGSNATFSGGVTVTGQLAVDTNTLFVDAVNNRVGIGTNNPAYALHVVYTGSNSVRFQGAVGGQISYASGSAIGAHYIGGWVSSANAGMYSQSASRLLFANGVATYGITLFGNDVIIGGDTPSAKLHVLNSSSSKIGAIIQAAAGQTANLLEVKNSGGTNLFHITASGGIATNGNAGFTGTGSYTNFTIENGIITAAS